MKRYMKTYRSRPEVKARCLAVEKRRRVRNYERIAARVKEWKRNHPERVRRYRRNYALYDGTPVVVLDKYQGFQRGEPWKAKDGKRIRKFVNVEIDGFVDTFMAKDVCPIGKWRKRNAR